MCTKKDSIFDGFAVRAKHIGILMVKRFLLFVTK